MTKSECYSQNLIQSEGFCAPFVAQTDDGQIHVGDCDNHETFETVQAAREYCNNARLDRKQLARAKRAHDGDHRDNHAAEYHWHYDAGLQISALDGL